jgi:hypothetical protein
MPIYEYDCPEHGQFERLQSIKFAEVKYSICCPVEGCNLICDKLAPRTANIQLGKPTIVFTNPQTGLSQIATSEHEQPPAGFIKKELKGPIERSKFEHQENSKASLEDAIYNENIRQGREAAREHLYKDIDKNMREDAATSDNPAETVRLMEAAKKHIANKKPKNRKRKTEFRFDVNHKDKSNLV